MMMMLMFCWSTETWTPWDNANCFPMFSWENQGIFRHLQQLAAVCSCSQCLCPGWIGFRGGRSRGPNEGTSKAHTELWHEEWLVTFDLMKAKRLNDFCFPMFSIFSQLLRKHCKTHPKHGYSAAKRLNIAIGSDCVHSLHWVQKANGFKSEQIKASTALWPALYSALWTAWTAKAAHSHNMLLRSQSRQ